MADLGLLTRFNFLKFYQARDENFSLALVARNIGIPDVSLALMEDPLPAVAVASLAYKPLRPLLVALDFSAPMNLNDLTLSEKPYLALGV
jgi:hypothetical protein